ncbi:response regulator transcription factor [Castellaniella sp.]|uniref:response regulator transcription factor n=1 Tax=Castellaniella sp. TaxID=1955812 RepID=UPI003A94A008
MATVTVVEPNTLLRLGILKLLQLLDCPLTATGIDYAQLFRGAQKPGGTDLMLLSVPDVFERMKELMAAAQQGYAPRRILLLSDTQTLPYSLLNFPPMLAGYISKYSSQDVLKSSVMLVLAGGRCFPHPHACALAEIDTDTNATSPAAPRRRRWYDHDTTAQSSQPTEPQPDNLLHSANPSSTAAYAPEPEPQQISASLPQTDGPAITAETMDREASLLRLTPRQYQVLALLAKGYPLKTISKQLNISVATAKTHTEALYQRLSVNSRNAAVYAAISRGATLGWHDPRMSPAASGKAPPNIDSPAN